MKAKILTLIVATASCLPSFAQEEWDLRKCIDYAIEHNLSIKQQEATRDQNAVELNTARWSRLPNLNGNVGQSFNFGRASGGQHLWQPQHPKHQFLIGNQCTVIHRFADTQQHSSL